MIGDTLSTRVVIADYRKKLEELPDSGGARGTRSVVSLAATWPYTSSLSGTCRDKHRGRRNNMTFVQYVSSIPQSGYEG
jgi:hypothetical protein